MCFVTEGEWAVAVQDEADTTATVRMSCDECHAIIEPGGFLHTIHQQESEECLACENGECSCTDPDTGDGDCCRCKNPDYGETFDYRRCESCDKFLKAVEAAELEAGCRIWQARPLLPNMIEDISEGGIKEARKYFKKAAALFPELVQSRYLGRLWCRMFWLGANK